MILLTAPRSFQHNRYVLVNKKYASAFVRISLLSWQRADRSLLVRCSSQADACQQASSWLTTQWHRERRILRGPLPWLSFTRSLDLLHVNQPHPPEFANVSPVCFKSSVVANLLSGRSDVLSAPCQVTFELNQQRCRLVYEGVN